MLTSHALIFVLTIVEATIKGAVVGQYLQQLSYQEC